MLAATIKRKRYVIHTPRSVQDNELVCYDSFLLFYSELIGSYQTPEETCQSLQ